MSNSNDRKAQIAKLNDLCRLTPGLFGQWVTTSGVAALASDTKVRLFRQVKEFSEFTEANDPHGEHDFGTIVCDGNKFFWKIDYYDRKDMNFGSEDPANALITKRVLTIMLASEF